MRARGTLRELREPRTDDARRPEFSDITDIAIYNDYFDLTTKKSHKTDTTLNIIIAYYNIIFTANSRHYYF